VTSVRHRWIEIYSGTARFPRDCMALVTHCHGT